MNFQEWIALTKSDKPELNDFITKLEPFFSDAGFNATEFERKVTVGLNAIDKKITDALNNQPNAAN